MPVDLSVANAILKEDYLGPLRSALNTSTPLFSRLEKNERDIAGKEAWIPIEMELNQGTGARGENEVLPVAGAGEYKELRVPLKHYYGVMSVTGPVMRQTEKGDRGSFGRIVDIEAKGIKKTLGLNLAHDFYAGDNLGLTTGATSGDATVELDSASRPYNMQWFRKGMRVDILDAGGAVVAGGSDLPITAVDKTAGTITVTGTPSDVAGGRVVRTGTAGKAMTSLEEIIDSTTDVYGVTTASYDEWKSYEDLSFGSFTTPKLLTAINQVVINSGKFPTVLVSDYATQELYFALLTAQPRYMVAEDSAKTLDGGFRALTFTGGGQPIPWIADRLAPAQTLYMIHEPDIQVFSPGDFSFIDIGGDVWLPDVIGATKRDNYSAVMYRDFELGAYMRNSHGKLGGVVA